MTNYAEQLKGGSPEKLWEDILQTSSMLRVADNMIRSWMPGTRDGSDRPAWKHPQDVVKMLTLAPGRTCAPHQDEASHLLTVAMLHDILEDGVKENGDRAGVDDLRGFPDDVVADIVALTRGVGEPKLAYLARLPAASARVAEVKCADRLCNLIEGRKAFSNKRWIKYLGETYLYILPLTERVEQLTGAWLAREILKACASRKVESLRGP